MAFFFRYSFLVFRGEQTADSEKQVIKMVRLYFAPSGDLECEKIYSSTGRFTGTVPFEDLMLCIYELDKIPFVKK